MILEAVNGVVDMTTSQAEVKGEVRITDVTGSVVADSAQIDLKSGAGTMKNADINFAAGDFHINAKEAYRDGDDTYLLKDTTLTTCHCAENEDCSPWRLRASEGKVVKDGYGQVWDATLEVLDIPVFYTPYLLFPAKSERQTGFLPGVFGPGGRTGFQLELPFYLVLDDSADITLTPIWHSRARVGGLVDYREMFSEKSNVDAQVLYFDESARQGRTLGTNISVLEGDKLPTERYAGKLNQNIRGEIFERKAQFLIDGKAVSDDLLLREYERLNWASYNIPYLTSTAVFRTELPADFNFDLSTQYSQSLTGSDNLIFQRLPEGQVNGLHTFRPFGDNDLGLKLVNTSVVDATHFNRLDLYTGTRYEAQESMKFPFHFRNYFDAQVEGNVRATKYDTQYGSDDAKIDVPDPANPGQTIKALPPSNSDRVVPGFNAKMGTVLEKVFDVEKGNPVKDILELGRVGRSQELLRMKHTLEPSLSYLVVPRVNQKDNPQFDAYDKLAQRNVVTYSLTQRLFGRYEPRNQYLYGIEEVTPRINDMGNLRSSTPVDDKLGFGIDDPNSDFQRLRIGSLSELANFKLGQSYSFNDPNRNNTSGTQVSQQSDVFADLAMFPNEYVGLHGRTNFNVENQDFNSYRLEGQLRNKRGDEIRTRFDSIGTTTRQLESNIEFNITDYTKIGYYERFSDITGKFTESRAGLRFLSSCKCWTFDVDVIDRLNPNQTSVLFGVTLVGLGELNQRVFSSYNAPPAAAN